MKRIYPQTLFNADILQNVRLEEVNPEKQKAAKETFNQKLKKLKPKFTLIQDYVNRFSNNRAQLAKAIHFFSYFRSAWFQKVKYSY